MENTRQIFSSLLIAIATLSIGVGFSWATGAVWSLIPVRTPIAQVATVPEPAGHEFFSAPRVAVVEESVRRPLSCYDLALLPIWNALKQDDGFIERVGYSEDSPDCSEMLEIERVDLNSDGRKEVLVRGKNFQLCGATGNCGFWVLEEGRTRHRIILSASDYVDVAELGQQVLKSRTHRYSDLLLKGHFSAAETGHYTYKFDGKKYAESRCMYEVPKYNSRNELGWEMITCEEFERRGERSIKGAE